MNKQWIKNIYKYRIISFIIYESCFRGEDINDKSFTDVPSSSDNHIEFLMNGKTVFTRSLEREGFGRWEKVVGGWEEEIRMEANRFNEVWRYNYNFVHFASRREHRYDSNTQRERE